jgi:eukaryotic-like serine/threonine-protein kinase
VAVLSKLARYRDIATLGSGGMATVVLAEDTLLGRQVALKRMHTAADPRGVARLRREALVGASISHPNVVGIYDVIATDDGDITIVMEYVQGETLRDALAREGELPVPQALRILEGTAAGLDAIHARGIVHRDVKPANILLGTDGAVKLADLGIASVPDRTRITTVGTVLGSFSYMAPEQLEDGPATPAIDIYALSAVAFEALSGTRAHPETNPLAVARAISSQPPPDLREAWPAAPAPAAELLSRGMSRDPARRPGSAGELVRDLAAALERPGPPPRSSVPPPVLEPGGGRAWILPGLLILLVALAIGLVLALGSSGGSGGSGGGPATGRSHTTAGSSHKAAPGSHAAGATSHAHSTTPTHSAAPTHTTSTSQSSGSAAPPSSSSSSTSTPTTTPSTTSTPATTAASGNGSPTAATASFYNLAAAHEFPQAWALADPTFQSQLGGYQSFQQGFATVRRIIFHADQVVSQSASSATVTVRTTSIHDAGAQQCAGTVNLVPGGGSGGWLLHTISIQCS